MKKNCGWQEEKMGVNRVKEREEKIETGKAKDLPRGNTACFIGEPSIV